VEKGCRHNASAAFVLSLLDGFQADDFEGSRIKGQPFIPLGVTRGFFI